MIKPPVTVRVLGPTWEVVILVDGFYGDAGGVANRLRTNGLAARRKGAEVLVNASGPLPT